MRLLPPGLVRIDEAQFPACETRFIHEHLRYYLSQLEILPVIRVLVDEEGPVVTDGHQYLQIAQELELPAIRAIVEPFSEPSDLERLDGVHEVEVLDWKKIDALEQATPVIEQWHIFYFERVLTNIEKDRFDQEVAGYFENGDNFSMWSPEAHGLLERVVHDDMGPRGRFLARMPIADESWFPAYLAAVRRFSRDVVPVVSFQGRSLD